MALRHHLIPPLQTTPNKQRRCGPLGQAVWDQRMVSDGRHSSSGIQVKLEIFLDLLQHTTLKKSTAFLASGGRRFIKRNHKNFRKIGRSRVDSGAGVMQHTGEYIGPSIQTALETSAAVSWHHLYSHRKASMLALVSNGTIHPVVGADVHLPERRNTTDRQGISEKRGRKSAKVEILQSL